MQIGIKNFIHTIQGQNKLSFGKVMFSKDSSEKIIDEKGYLPKYLQYSDLIQEKVTEKFVETGKLNPETDIVEITSSPFNPTNIKLIKSGCKKTVFQDSRSLLNIDNLPTKVWEEIDKELTYQDNVEKLKNRTYYGDE